MKKIFIDAGHGGTDGGAEGSGLKEKDVTFALAQKTAELLYRLYAGHQTKVSRTTGQTLSLTERTNAANQWGADLLVSIHVNAGGGKGFESYVYNGSFPGKNITQTMRTNIHGAIIDRTGWYDRGEKEANFHMLRESSMPACLTENGFIDHIEDVKKLSEAPFLDRIAKGHATGIARALDLQLKRESSTDTVYRVVTGSFTNRQHAHVQINSLQKQGFESFVLPFTLGKTTYYRVVTGAFEKRENAERRMKDLKKAGFDSFILVST